MKIGKEHGNAKRSTRLLRTVLIKKLRKITYPSKGLKIEFGRIGYLNFDHHGDME